MKGGVVCIILLFAVVAARHGVVADPVQAPAQQPAAPAAPAPAPAMSKPLIVPSLAAVRGGGSGSGEQPENPHPLPYPNNDDHAWVSQLQRLQIAIEKHDKVMKTLHHELEAAKKHGQVLRSTQRLVHGMVSQHQAENVLALLDGHISGIKQLIKKVGDEADDAVRNRADLQKQLKDSVGSQETALQKIRDQLASQQAVLEKLCAKREEVAGIVSGWRDHVAGLWGQHGLPPRKPAGESIVIPELPRPPSAEEEEEQEKEDAEKTEQAAEGDDGSAAGSDAGTEGKPAKNGKQPKKAELEVVAEEPAEPEKTADPEKKGTGEAGGDGSDDTEADTSGITAYPHEIKATQDSIEELLKIHVPRLTGITFGAPAPAPAPAAGQKQSFRELAGHVRHHRGRKRH